MLNIVSLAILIAVAVLLVSLSLRARRLRNGFLRWSGMGLAMICALALFLVGGLGIVGLVKAHTRSAPVPELKVAGTPQQIQRGKAIADSFCGGCHSTTGTLTGGLDIGEKLPLPMGTFVAANLTPAGQLSHWSDGEIFRAIRNGVDADGHWLTIMSYTNAGKLSDDDIQSLIAYLRSRPAAGQVTVNPPDSFSPLGIIMLGAGMMPGGKPIIAGAITAPPKGPTVQYGDYILSYQDCRECHGADLTGGVQGQLAPLGPGLNVVKDWKLDQFVATMRTGIDPAGHQLSDEMPWRQMGKMDDDELTAIYQYLTHMPEPQSTAAN